MDLFSTPLDKEASESLSFFIRAGNRLFCCKILYGEKAPLKRGKQTPTEGGFDSMSGENIRRVFALLRLILALIELLLILFM